ncbi:MAG: Ribulose-phosphate 3-epimerase [Eubacteriales bacterium SKADARSKE-1]|nr:Ribulose-phosphate 3-epimerase [Eubacteriales bacterium SKADARSKE-1]
MKIAPSLLACDFANLNREIKKVTDGEADYIHLDVMDGNFVPNITFGAPVIKSIRKCTGLPFDVHLMIDNPKRYIEDFVKAGADIITIHVEAENDIIGTLKKIKSYGVKTGISVKPNTKIEDIYPFLLDIDLVLVMTVEPGFGGQKFIFSMMEKIETLKKELKIQKLNPLIEVDGGIDEETVKIAANFGVDICVAGTSIFGKEDIFKAIKQLKGNT